MYIEDVFVVEFMYLVFEDVPVVELYAPCI